MTFYIEAHPQGYPNLAVPVLEGPNANDQEHAHALAVAAAEASGRFRNEYPMEKMGAAIVFACHDGQRPINPAETL